MGQFSYNPLNGNLDFSSNGLEAGTLEFMGNISVASDFPTSAQVQENDIYRVLANVTDNDGAKTNTGQSFVAGDEIMWDGAGWDLLGNYVSLLGTNNTWTGTNSFDLLGANTLRAVGSGGLLIEANNGTDVALFGAGGGAGATFYGGVTIQDTVTITASSTANALYIDHNNNGISINVDGEQTTAICADFVCDVLTTGSVLRAYSNSGDTSERNLAVFKNDNALATGTRCIYAENDATGGIGIMSNGRVIIGTTDAHSSAQSAMVINSSLTAGAAGSGSLVIQGESNKERIKIYSSGGGQPVINMLCSRGSIASPTATQINDLLSGVSGSGYGATGYGVNCYGVLQLAGENWTDSAQGTYTLMKTTQNGTTSPTNRLIINHDGSVTLGSSFGIGTGALYAGVGTFNTSSTSLSGITLIHSGVIAGGQDGMLINCTGANTNANSSALYVLQSNASTTTPTLRLYHAGNGRGIQMETLNTTATALNITTSSLTTGRGALIYSNSSSTGQFGLLELTSANAAATGCIPFIVTNVAPTNTNFFRIAYFAGNSGGNYFWKANGVTPNGALNGSVGDICFGADGGKVYYCSGSTTWVAM